ncbi:hypothetical protein COSHB9_17780 [Companilactobacillus alimentarius]|uniref:Uncharacterized protein n=1 Tax=Companilactobacillus alimentarius DSM 20249 TaxID=1423720 RepID=A0A2K9HM89_9LACO|nr:hypothetical protein [Companilactobacillus alimentarius]AUI72235.1 hypothetical protein LA20249_08595 [Companilactobacillus alimentarius DSM 20249]KRK77543.1 hypothetical protein FC67_GL000297 [Companilactobacillus alimentarius DSM 20249]MDT6952805.1 hypothetical protein [Companilactobacillus alimentarius]GEO45458.1 hypothetical protein LAL01_16900 [Companilactobacillus alimentarius]
MEHSKQKLLISLLVEFSNSFSKQINESAINQEMEHYIKRTVQDFVERQYRGSVFNKEFKKMVDKVNHAKDNENLVLNYRSDKLWTEISELSKKTTSFANAYSIIDLLGKNKDAFF